MAVSTENFYPLLILLISLALVQATDDPHQGVSIDVTIPNDAFKNSYVVNLTPGQRVHLVGSEGSVFDRRARRLLQKTQSALLRRPRPSL